MKKLERTFVRDEAYLLLRDKIVDGILKPGEKLRDKELAEQLGVSRTPIREALLKLENEGFVETKPNCSTQVSPIDFQNALNLYTLVWTLEQAALRQAFPLSPKQIEEMVQANDKFSKALQKNDKPGAFLADNDFHAVYVRTSGNEELQTILSGLKLKLKRLEFYYYTKVKKAHTSYEEHLEIIEALRERNLVRALQAIEANWRESLRRMHG